MDLLVERCICTDISWLFSAVGVLTHGKEKHSLCTDLDQILNGRFQYAHAIENARVENWTLFSNRANTEF